MAETSIAVVADIHGNRWALEAVLADLRGRGVQTIVNLGDSLYGPLDPLGTADVLLGREIFSVSGNEDRCLVQPGAEFEPSPTWRYTYDSLRPEHLRWLAGQPLTAVVQVAQTSAFLCHGTPTSDTDYLLEQVTPAGVWLRAWEDLVEALAPIAQRVVLCGHSHVARSVQLPDGRLVVNPGSVGLQAYSDDAPCAHVMEAGTPHARYCLLTHTPDGLRVEQVAVPYAWKAAAEAALAHGRPDWAAWLRSGWAGR